METYNQVYSILTHHRPLEGSVEYILKSTLKGNVRDPQSLVDFSLPNSLIAVVKKAMALEPDHRYSSVLELKGDIQKYLAGYSTLAEDSNLYKEFKLFIKRNKATSFVSFSALLVIVFISFYFIDALKKEVNETRIASEKAQSAAAKASSLLDELTSTFLEEAELASKTFIYQYPSESLARTLDQSQKILTTIPGHPVAQEHFIYALFIMQRFDDVLRSPYTNNYPEISQLCEKYAPLISAKTNQLTPINLAQLIGELKGKVKNHYSVGEKMLAYVSEKSKYTASFGHVVKELIKILNPQWDGSGYEYSNNRNKLDLTSPQIKYLKGSDDESSGQSILRFMRIDKLNLKGSAVEDLAQLKSIKIQTLDIRDTPIKDLNKLYTLKKLSELVGYEGQLDDKQISKLPRSIRVRVVEVVPKE